MLQFQLVFALIAFAKDLFVVSRFIAFFIGSKQTAKDKRCLFITISPRETISDFLCHFFRLYDSGANEALCRNCVVAKFNIKINFESYLSVWKAIHVLGYIKAKQVIFLKLC